MKEVIFKIVISVICGSVSLATICLGIWMIKNWNEKIPDITMGILLIILALIPVSIAFLTWCVNIRGL